MPVNGTGSWRTEIQGIPAECGISRRIRSATSLPSSSFEDVRNRIVEVRRYDPARAFTDGRIRDGVENVAAIQAVCGWRRGALRVRRPGAGLGNRRRDRGAPRLMTELGDLILCLAELVLGLLKIGASAKKVLAQLPRFAAGGLPTAGEEDRVRDRHGGLKFAVGQPPEKSAKLGGGHGPKLKPRQRLVYTLNSLAPSGPGKRNRRTIAARVTRFAVDATPRRRVLPPKSMAAALLDDTRDGRFAARKPEEGRRVISE